MRPARAALFCLALVGHVLADATPEVATDRGRVRGVRAGATNAFRGIPYAAPPVDALRFAAPRAHEPWSAPRDASNFGACCPQVEPGGDGGSEDCLTLNLWTPAAKGPPRPVLVFLHGGANIEGCAAAARFGKPTYDGEHLAETQNAVVVTLNYRLGALGFLASPAQAKDSLDLGLRDQLAALAWVQHNIAAFGGDPKRVLLFGESAGATDTCALVASPLGKGLFASALMESGRCIARGLDAGHEQAHALAQKLGCDDGDLACLRKQPAAALVKASAGVFFGPIVDGAVLPAEPLEQMRRGKHNHVPVILGDNSAEMLFFMRRAQIDAAAYRDEVTRFVGAALADKIVARYPLSAYGGDARDALIAATSDQAFVCPTRTTARALAAAQTEPVYRYFFTHVLQTRSRPPDHGAMHGLELLFVFGHLEPFGYRPTPSELALSATLERYWTRFAATGDPNSAGDPPWQRYDVKRDDHLVLDDAPQMAAPLKQDNCDFWDALGPLPGWR